ncbi:MAG: ATP-binding cassette domain-containing protein [Alphaproteobacteria bacterium]|nr:ATP-binding cassette domain-containing protein [Alphaproteobacteria bacterium]
MIVVENLSKHFGGIKAVDNVSLSIAPGSITGLIGPNGAGKTTLFNVIAGLHAPTSGRVLLDGQDITGLPPHELFARGMLRTFQIAHEFSTLTVRENLMLVPGGQSGERLMDAWLRPARVRAEEAALRRKADEVIEFLQINQVADELAGNLSGGQKKLLELGRTMMVDAKIVFLDEVGAGVNRTLLRTIGDAIQRLNSERGYTFCMIEHDMEFISRLCDPVIVMAEGAVLATGTAAEVRANEEVIEAYLGCVMSFLVGEEMVCGYGGADILHGCTIGVEPGEIAVVVGPNGAGKSTAMKAMFGMLGLREGRVLLEGEDISRLKPQERVLRGMGFVPQTNNVFTSMTVEENLEMGAFIRRDDIATTMRQVFDLFPILHEKRAQPAGELSGGQRQQVAVGRALMTQPKILMLDEPTAGVSPIVMDELFDRIIEVAQTGIAILMVEQNAKQALNIADRGYVLVQGRNAYTDTGAALMADPEVRRAFLGG